MSETPEPKPPVRPDPGAGPTRRQLLLGGGHLAALWALAFVQPLLDLLGGSPEFFVARGNTAGDILILAIGFTLVPPLVLLAIEWAVSRIGRRTYRSVHFVFITVIAAFLFMPLVGDHLTSATALVIILGLCLALLVAVAILRFTFVRNLMDILIAAPVVILLLFVFASSTSSLIVPGGDFKLAEDSGTDRPIVVVVFDELGTAHLMNGRGEIDADRYPNFARLAKDGTWYRNNTTTADSTPIAVPELLTGVKQPGNTLPTWQERPQNIFSQFGRDRPLNVREPITALCPQDLCPEDPDHASGRTSRLEALWSDLKYVEGRLILPPRIADTLPDVSSNFTDFGGSAAPDAGASSGGTEQRTLDQYREAIRGIPDSPRGLTVMHFELPHETWKFDTRGREYNSSPIMHLAEGGERWRVDDSGIAVAQAQMYTQTGFADRILGEIRARLTRLGLWDEAMVVVAADHGISFLGGDVPQRQLDRRAMGEVANPPLLIKYPNQKRGGVSDKHSLTLDVVPTIARALEVKHPYRMDGVPLQGPVPDRRVTLKDEQGKTISKPLDAVIRQRDQAILRAERRLGTGPFYTLGPAPELIGRAAPPVPARPRPAWLDLPGLWNEYLPNRALVPMFVTGTTAIPAPTRPDRAPIIAIGVNGKIQGTGRIFAYEGATRFGALVNPASLHRGRNEIGIYLFTRDGRLVPLGGN